MRPRTALRRAAQPGITDATARWYAVQRFGVRPGVDVDALRRGIAATVAAGSGSDGPDWVVVAFGPSLLGTLHPDAVPPGTRPFTGATGVRGEVRAARDDLLLWHGGRTAHHCEAGVAAARSALEATTVERGTYAGRVGDQSANPTDEVVVADPPWTGAVHVVAMWWDLSADAEGPSLWSGLDGRAWARSFGWAEDHRSRCFVATCAADPDVGSELVERAVRGGPPPGSTVGSLPPVACGFFVAPGVRQLEELLGGAAG
ncbi:MAG: hypothetical protein ACKOYM_07665 [Actinomycetes bacterium]